MVPYILNDQQWKFIRDVTLFAVGVAVFIFFVLFWATTGTPPNLSLLGGAIGFATAPVALRRDEKRRNNNG